MSEIQSTPSATAPDAATVPHPKLEREKHRGRLQEDLAAKLAGNEGAPRPVALIGDSLVDVATWKTLDAAVGEHPERYLAAMHALAADPEFRWVGYRQGSDNRGEVESVALGGSSWAVSDRADPSYQARLKARGRREILAALERGWASLKATKASRIAEIYGERFVTLTAPSRGIEDRMKEWKAHNQAMGKLRESKAFRGWVWGGVKNLEDSGTDDVHVHSHSIWISRYLPQVALAWMWTGCKLDADEKVYGQRPADPRQALLNQGWTLERVIEVEGRASLAKMNLREARNLEEKQGWQEILAEATATLKPIRAVCYVVDVRLVGKARASGTVTRQEAILEVCKYVTKTTDLLGRSWKDLLALLLPPRAPRVFDSFGACRKAASGPSSPMAKALETAAEIARSLTPTSLDTAAITSGTPGAGEVIPADQQAAAPPSGTQDPPPKRPRPPSWRVLMQQLDLSDFIAVMRARAAASAAFAMGRLKDSGIVARTLVEVEAFGGCPNPFTA